METNEQITEWKEQYGFIYKASIDGTDYIFRTLTREDYMDITAKQMTMGISFDNELEVVKTSLLEPEVNAEMEKVFSKKGGLVSVLSEKIMLRSGFQQVEEEEL